MKRLLLSVFIFCGIIVFLTCDEEVLDKSNPNELTNASFFKTEDQAISAVNSIYAGLQANNLYNREYFFLHDLLSDDMESGGSQLETVRAQVLTGSFDGSNKLINDNWRGWYRVILRANWAIDNLPNAENVPEGTLNRLIGEAKYLRGWAYFELVSLWGPVPMPIEPSSTPEGIPRADSEEMIYSQIFNDLDSAEMLLPTITSYSGADVGRASREAAQALKGKIHMFRAEYQDALTELEKVISSGKFSLVDRYLDNFQEENENNEESIFEVQFSTAFGTGGAWSAQGNGIAEITFRGQEYGPNAWRNVVPNDDLLDEYEKTADGVTKDDPRFEYSFYEPGETFNNGQDTLAMSLPDTSWKKYQMIYKQENENSNSGINFRVIRYADVLLMAAEAENEVNGPTDKALNWLNATRNRADVQMDEYPTTQYPTGTQEEFFQAVMHERRVELAGEQIRNRDIRRWRRHKGVENDLYGAYQERHDLLPLPTTNEIDNNSALTQDDQNPGW